MLKTNFTENNVDKILHAYTHSDNGNDNSQRFKFPYITTVYFFLIFQHSNASTHARPYITFKLSSLSLSRSNILKCSIVSFMWSAHTYCIYYFVFSLSLVSFSSLPQLWYIFLFKMLLRFANVIHRKLLAVLHHFSRVPFCRWFMLIGSILKILHVFV